jgi:transcriptional regulator with XRE-family HTH domain
MASRSNGASPEYSGLGEHLRAARRAHGLSLRALADRLGVSPSLISQVETGRARPSVSTLYAIASELDISLDEILFEDRRRGQTGEARPLSQSPAGGPLQRSHERKAIRLASGVVWERLTTTTVPEVEFLAVTYEPGGASSPANEYQRHAGQEWGYVLTGRLGVTIGFEEYVLGPGDSIAIDSAIPHRLYNVGEEPVHGIWFVLGRGTFFDAAQLVPAVASPASDRRPAER